MKTPPTPPDGPSSAPTAPPAPVRPASLPESDVLILGAGMVGLAVARALTRFAPGIAITVLERHEAIPGPPVGRRAGVIHSGIFTAPGTERAHLGRAGRAALQRFAQEASVPMERCGKLIVATTVQQRERLAEYESRAAALGVRAQRLDAAGIREREPAVTGIGGLLLEDAGIIDYPAVIRALSEDVHLAGGRVVTGADVVAIEGTDPAGADRPATSRVSVTTADGRTFTARGMIACCGRTGDRIADLAGVETDIRVATFRSEYHQLRESASSLCRHLIYPVPDADARFIGAHLARRPDGRVECGPGAILAVDPDDVDTELSAGRRSPAIALRGVRRRLGRRLRGGVPDVRPPCSRRALIRELQNLVPAIDLDDLEAAPAGIRAQAISADGNLMHELVVAEGPANLHVLNPPSPVATSALAVGETIAERALERPWARTRSTPRGGALATMPSPDAGAGIDGDDASPDGRTSPSLAYQD